MVILLTGASGFIGRHLSEALTAAGHEVIHAVRSPSQPAGQVRTVPADFTRDFDPRDWMPRLAGVDAVINAVGIIREQGQQTFDAIHSRAPQALFQACAASGVRKLIQISALGADAQARSRYHLSKKKADDFLAGLPLQSVIVQPSLVYGPGGTSARLFNLLASLPLIPLPGRGEQRIQPVHIDDVTSAILALLEEVDGPQPPDMSPMSSVFPVSAASPTSPFLPESSIAAAASSPERVVLAGPQAVTLRGFLERLRYGMGLGNVPALPVPGALMKMGAAAGRLVPGGLLDPETLQMLERGNTAGEDDVRRMTQLLGRPARGIERFISPGEAPAARMTAQSDWLLWVLRISIALVWVVTGIVSLGLYPVEDSYALLARVGITGMLAPLMLYGAALLDLSFGIAILILRKRRWLWIAQLAVILFYTLIISWKLPEFWLHPYGPLLKNLPMLAAIWLLLEWERP